MNHISVYENPERKERKKNRRILLGMLVLAILDGMVTFAGGWW